MCGICGFYGMADKELLNKMLKVLTHRGPDDHGTHIENDLMLGHRRLSIIDLFTGKQPIYNEDRSVCIVYNGEIYNFMELRETLKRKGHKFITETDTEVVVHSYEEYGIECVKQFNGMFAFALWDRNKKLLFIARDRYGIKPLFYYKDDNKFIFASELKAIFQDETITKQPNEGVIYDYLINGVHDHSESTFFKGIKMLMPAHYMIVNRDKLQIKRYWELKYTKEIEAAGSAKQVQKAKIAEFLRLFEDSVRKRLISDVPVGTCLSGGLDSSAITCVINKLLIEDSGTKAVIGDRQKTFSAVYKDKEIDERSYIETVINSVKAETNYVFPEPGNLIPDLKKMLYYHDEPFGGPSVYAQWKVMELASNKVKVLLDGQGGDELLAGYIYYYLEYYFELFRKRKYPRLIFELILSMDKIYPIFKSAMNQREVSKCFKGLLHENLIASIKSRSGTLDMQEPDTPPETLAERLFLSLTKHHIPHLLRYEDRNSMAFSIEARVPFLDHRIVEYVFSLPQIYRINSGWTKYILRRSMKGTLPERIRLRRSKLGFATPEAKWLKAAKAPIRKIFNSPEFGKRDLIDQDALVAKFDKFCNGTIDDYYASIFWKILILELWFQTQFVDS